VRYLALLLVGCVSEVNYGTPYYETTTTEDGADTGECIEYDLKLCYGCQHCIQYLSKSYVDTGLTN